MQAPTPYDPVPARRSASRFSIAMAPKRVSVPGKKEKQKREDERKPRVPPVKRDMDDDDGIGEVDRPSSPSDKPQAPPA